MKQKDCVRRRVKQYNQWTKTSKHRLDFHDSVLDGHKRFRGYSLWRDSIVLFLTGVNCPCLTGDFTFARHSSILTGVDNKQCVGDLTLGENWSPVLVSGEKLTLLSGMCTSESGCIEDGKETSSISSFSGLYAVTLLMSWVQITDCCDASHLSSSNVQGWISDFMGDLLGDLKCRWTLKLATTSNSLGDLLGDLNCSCWTFNLATTSLKLAPWEISLSKVR